MRQRVEDLWREHLTDPFPPDCRGEEIDGVDLTLLDAETAGCISTFLGCAGRLDPQRRKILTECYTQLVAVGQRLEGESARYFRRQAEGAGLVLDETGGR